jgi:hypothetical protein
MLSELFELRRSAIRQNRNWCRRRTFVQRYRRLLDKIEQVRLIRSKGVGAIS